MHAYEYLYAYECTTVRLWSKSVCLWNKCVRSNLYVYDKKVYVYDTNVYGYVYKKMYAYEGEVYAYVRRSVRLWIYGIITQFSKTRNRELIQNRRACK